MNQYLTVKLVELKNLFKHLPLEHRLPLEANLRTVFTQIEQAMNYKPQPPAEQPQAS